MKRGDERERKEIEREVEERDERKEKDIEGTGREG